MARLKLTPTEEKWLADAFVTQALAMGLKGNKKLRQGIKEQVREKVLASIQSDRKASHTRETKRTIS